MRLILYQGEEPAKEDVGVDESTSSISCPVVAEWCSTASSSTPRTKSMYISSTSGSLSLHVLWADIVAGPTCGLAQPNPSRILVDIEVGVAEQVDNR